MERNSGVFGLCFISAVIGFGLGVACEGRSTVDMLHRHEATAASLCEQLNALDDALNRFEDENWRDVVPDVKDAAREAHELAETLRAGLQQDQEKAEASAALSEER